MYPPCVRCLAPMAQKDWLDAHTALQATKATRVRLFDAHHRMPDLPRELLARLETALAVAVTELASLDPMPADPLIWLSGVLVGVLPELDLQLSPGWASAASVELGWINFIKGLGIGGTLRAVFDLVLNEGGAVLDGKNVAYHLYLVDLHAVHLNRLHRVDREASR